MAKVKIGKFCLAANSRASRAVVSEKLQWDITVFFLGIRVAFVFERAERSDHASACVSRFNDGIDVAAFCGDKRIGKALAEFRDFFLAESFALGFRSFCQLTFVDNVY